tara:strand:+ start:1019 stop:1252 length:234 start_codon:yes stop_codon:yes gene_type:complete
MIYNIKLDEEQFMALIEMIEKHRCEGEEDLCSLVRTSVKAQFQEQFMEKEDAVTVEADDVLEAAKKTLGPGYCDNCD